MRRLSKAVKQGLVTKRGDWSYWQGGHLLGHTLRHRIRLWIGLDGLMHNGDYVFKRVRYGTRLHRLLNWFLADRIMRAQR